MRLSVKQIREQISKVLDRVARGEEAIIVRRGKPVARLVPVEKANKRLPPLDRFRAALHLKGTLSKTVVQERKEARY